MKRIAVIGGGTIGLTTALTLQERGGVDVTIWAREVPPATTSDVAAAMWMPYLAGPDELVHQWSADGLPRFAALSRVSKSGVTELPLVLLHRGPKLKPPWIELVRAVEAPAIPGLTRDYETQTGFLSYRIDVPLYMPYLVRRFQEQGGTFIRRELRSLDEIPPSHDVIINCSGMGSRELCGDAALIPVAGQQVTTGPASHLPYAIGVPIDEKVHSIIVPRSTDCYIGGTTDHGVYDQSPSPAVSDALLERAYRVWSPLRDLVVQSARVGLRPYRKEVRLEIDGRGSLGRPVIHNYGHGGCGHTLSWGCAAAIAALVDHA